MEVKSTKNSSISDIKLSIAICKAGSDYHTGFLFENSDKMVKFLHLAWFEQLKYDSFLQEDSRYSWLDIPFDEYNLELFTIFLEQIYIKNGQNVPYGIAIDGISFKNDGSLLTEEEFSGLTCATFVLRALQARGFLIIDINNWKIRGEDASRQQYLIEMLETHSPAAPEYIEHQKQYIGKVARFKPSEVAVAANTETPPLPQSEIMKLANELESLVN